jgi:hypothetical protein
MFADDKATSLWSGDGVHGRLALSPCRSVLATLLGVIAFMALARLGPSAAPEVGGQAPPSAPPKVPLYETDIEPLLQAKCLRCHGGKAQKAALDLRTHAGILKGGESGPAVVPGKLDKSLLYEKIRDGLMPPTDKNHLSEAEVATIRRWIEAGAPRSEKLSPASTHALTQHDVIPILLRRCTVCHGSRRREGGLDLRSKASMLRGGKSGPAIVPGKAEESLVIKKLRSGQMPPLRRLIEVSIKPIEPAETDLLAKWIGLGAPEVQTQPDVAGTEPDPLVTDKERDFWAFRPPQPVPVPTVRHPAQLRNPIDAFILHRLEQKGLLLAPEADRPALMRRLYLDLTGLPPEPTEVLAFVADRDPQAYEKMVDRLLASPRYGERWGRHWLDVAGYADSEGKREQDQPRLFAYRYRDYVIQALNADKPYDRFLRQQIAGDELQDYEHAPEITQEMCDNLVATGFLRMAPDPTWYNLTDFVPDRIDVIADEIDVLSAAVMGLTLKCARCHSHKFDPIPQRDYYRLIDIFKGAFDEYDWMKSNWHFSLSMGPRSDRDLAYVTTAERRQWEADTAALQKGISALGADLDRQAASLSKKYFEERLAQLPETIRDDVRTALATSAQKRSTIQAYLAARFEKTLRPDRNELLKVDAGFKRQVGQTDRRIQALEAKRLPEPKVRALWDRGDPSPTYLYRRGDYLSPGRLVGPGVPSVLTDGKTPFEVKPPWPGAKKTGRRLALARWLTKPDHPLTARVMVNRLWKHHFGVGLVKTLDNFGKTGARPTHPELLDWLAREFIRQGWSLKAMHRLLVTSATYRQASLITPEREKRDPDNVLYSRMPLQRLSAEQLYDTMLLVAGRLNESRFGPPDSVEVRPDGLVTPAGTVAGWRRSIYVQQQRKVVVTHLENFDLPQMNPNCIDRRDSTVVPQALHLMNNGMVHQLADRFAHRVKQEAGPDLRKQIEWVYLVALSRLPSAEEKEAGLADLARLTKHWAQHLAPTARLNANEAAQQALATYCHAIMNTAEFLYLD